MIGMGDWAATPPEVNAYVLMAGDHAVSTTAAATAHQALADAMISQGALMGTNTAGTAGAGWQGVGGVSMLATSAMYITALEALSAWVQASSLAAATIAEAYTTAEAAMIPGEVVDANRAAQAGLVATNFFGQNTPGIVALEIEYIGHFWTQNAAVMGAYESAVTGVLGTLAVPPPLSPLTGNPAGPLAGVAQAAAQAGARVGLQSGFQSMTAAADAPVAGETAIAPAAAPAEAMSTFGPIMQQFSQVGQIAGELPQMVGQLPQMATGLLGPLQGAMSSLGNPAGGVDPLGGTVSHASLAPVAGLGALAAGGGGGLGMGGGGLGMAGPAVLSSFTRPSSSFNAPDQPRLPTGWTSSAEPAAEVAGATRPAGGGVGGLYGAPAAMGAREAGTGEGTPARTMQLTGRPARTKGDDRQN